MSVYLFLMLFLFEAFNFQKLGVMLCGIIVDLFRVLVFQLIMPEYLWNCVWKNIEVKKI